MPFVHNPQRRATRFSRRRDVPRALLLILCTPLVRLGLRLGFTNVDYSYVHGRRERLRIGERCSTMNTIFNVVSGDIEVGDDTMFGHGCQVVTGEHRFYEGRRASLSPGSPFRETPAEGNDIRIGKRCFIASGVIVSKGVTIGDDVIVAAGSVVTRDLPSGCFAAGAPARVLRAWGTAEYEAPDAPLLGAPR